MIGVRIEGGKELDNALKSLDRKIARKALSSAVREGANVILRQAKSNAPVRTGLVKKKLRVRVARKRRGETVAFKVQTGEGAFKGKTFYASFVEFGHKIGKRPGRRAVSDTRGEVPAKPFMEPAYIAKRNEAVKVITESLRAKIDEAVRAR